MMDVQSIQARVQWLEKLSYYDILEVPKDAEPRVIKQAFHEFALECHPDRFVDHGPALANAAAELFKRGVEAYQVLSKPAVRTKYDAGLLRGKLRYVEGELASAPPPPKMRTLEEIATTPRARQFARKADRFISLGKLEEARVALVTAMQDDFDNEELKERLNILYEALALEPL